MEPLLKKHAAKLKFGLVGGANTAIDFGILFVLTALGVNKFVANIASTGVAFVFSFFVNKSFTFKNKSKNVKKQFALFTVITLFGLWVIQPIIIILSDALFGSFITDGNALLFVGKIFATIASLIWNYLLYSRLVFKDEAVSKQKETEV